MDLWLYELKQGVEEVHTPLSLAEVISQEVAQKVNLIMIVIVGG